LNLYKSLEIKLIKLILYCKKFTQWLKLQANKVVKYELNSKVNQKINANLYCLAIRNRVVLFKMRSDLKLETLFFVIVVEWWFFVIFILYYSWNPHAQADVYSYAYVDTLVIIW